MDVKRTIDINCDLGEGMINDEFLMPCISSCNIACGGHFGTKETMRTAIRLAKHNGVKIGAHPSYPDPENFGRKSMDISPSDLAKSLKEQISNFLVVCQEENVHLNHIKLHGALYNDCANDESLALIILQVLDDLSLSVPVYTPKCSILSEKLNNTVSEAFIDRRYCEDGNLVSRSQDNALISDLQGAWNQLEQIYFKQEVTAENGKIVPLIADTFCIHGDAEFALEIARLIKFKLDLLLITLDKDG